MTSRYSLQVPSYRDRLEAGAAIVRTVGEPLSLTESVATAIEAERNRVVDAVHARLGVECVCRVCLSRELEP